MKVYMFYIYGDKIYNKSYVAISDNTIDVSSNVPYALYAFTNNKEYSKKFKEYRNMKIFFEKVVKMTKEEYKELKEKYVECELNEILYKHPTLQDSYYSTCDLMYILSTNLESDRIRFESNYYISKIFDKIKSTLTYIEPDDFIPNISYVLKNVFEYNGMINWLDMIDDIPFDMCIVNEVAMYAYLYENTYKKGRVIECIYTGSLRNQTLQMMKSQHQFGR